MTRNIAKLLPAAALGAGVLLSTALSGATDGRASASHSQGGEDGVLLAQAPPPPPPPPPVKTVVKTAPAEAAETPPPPPPPPDQPAAPSPAPTTAPSNAPATPAAPAPSEPPQIITVPQAPTPAPTPGAGEQTIRAMPGAGSGTGATADDPTVDSAANTAPDGQARRAGADKDIDDSDFIKGDLVHVGTMRMLSRYDHFGARLGPNFLDSQMYLTVDPGFAAYWDRAALSMHVPLNLLAGGLEGRTPVYGGMKIRRQDWDERADFAKVIRFFTIGHKEDKFYLTVNSLRPTTIGHGLLMNSYQPAIDVDKSLTGVTFDAYNDLGGFQAQINDVTFQNQIIGGLAFLKPLSLLSGSLAAKTFSIGVEYVADMQAPICVLNNNGLSDGCVQASGHVDGMDPFATDLSAGQLNRTFVNTDETTGRYKVKTGVVQAAGLSSEVKVIKTHGADVKLYGTFHRFLNEGGGDGLAGGVLGRFNTGSTWVSAFRLRGEFRSFGDGFWPGYFDTMYEVSKYEFAHAQRNFQVTPTKYQAVFGDPTNGFERPEYGSRQGYRLEASWALFFKKRRYKQLSLGVGLSDSTGPYDSNFYAHLEFPAWQFLQVFGSYLRVNGDSFEGLFTSDTFNDGNAVVLAGLRLQVLPILFINAHWSRSYSVVRSPGQEYHLANDSVRRPDGSAARYPQDRLFENRDTLLVELEIGYEFDSDVE